MKKLDQRITFKNLFLSNLMMKFRCFYYSFKVYEQGFVNIFKYVDIIVLK